MRRRPRGNENKRLEYVGILTLSIFGVILLMNFIAFQQHDYLPISQFYQKERKDDFVSLSNKILSGESVTVSKINEYSNEYTINASALCGKDKVRIMVFIMSPTQNYHLRHVIRHTMIKDVYRRYNNGIKFAFLLGFSQRGQYIIENEDTVFKDVIQQNFIDSRRNDTLKVIMAYDWIQKYCNSVEDIVFIQDDVLLNVETVFQYLFMKQEMETTRYLYSGELITSEVPNRDLFKERHVSYQEYPYELFPFFIHGGFILQNRKCVQKFLSIFPYIKYFPLYDVYLGIVAFELGIKPMHNVYVRTTEAVVASNHSKMALAERLSSDPDIYYKQYVSISMNKSERHIEED